MKLSEEQQRTMNKLLEDHKTSREETLADVNLPYIQGYHISVKQIHKKATPTYYIISSTYRNKKIKIFFPVMDYFNTKECDIMLQEFIDFDKNMIHNYYSALVEKNTPKC